MQALRDDGVKQEKIANIIGVHPSTISREIARNRRKGRKKRNAKNRNARYEAGMAQHKAYVRRKYAKYQGKRINEDEVLKQYIIAKLKQHWNPDEISGRMKRDKEPFFASKTAIYEWLRTSIGDRYCKYLYSGRHSTKRRYGISTKRQMIPNRIGIEYRPLGATNRTRYGHFEGDTIVSGKKTRSKVAIAVIYERKAKYIDARKIPSLSPMQFSGSVNEMIEQKYAKSISLDNGLENRAHSRIVVPAFFCNPYSSWQKGGVEHANKMIRMFIPKGVDLASYSDDDVRGIIRILNNKPRKSLRYATPQEVMVKQAFKNKKIPLREIALGG